MLSSMNRILTYVFLIVPVCLFVIAGCKTRNPEESNNHLTLGMERMNKNDLAQALDEYNMAIQLDEKNSSAFYHRAGLYFGKHDVPNCLKDLDEAISISP